MEWKIIGIIAAISTTSGFIPQLIKGIRTKRLDDVSPVMYVIMLFGFSMWLTYGIHLKDVIIVGANVFALFFSLVILILRHRYLKKG